jgi:hypothetical protein
MAIRQIRLPDPTGTPRLVVSETPATSVPPKPAPAPAPTPVLVPTPAPEAVPPPAAAVRALPSSSSRRWYRSESWLAVELAAVVPVVAALVAPEAFRIPLVALGGLLVALGLAMLVVHERDARRAEASAG